MFSVAWTSLGLSWIRSRWLAKWLQNLAGFPLKWASVGENGNFLTQEETGTKMN